MLLPFKLNVNELRIEIRLYRSTFHQFSNHFNQPSIDFKIRINFIYYYMKTSRNFTQFSFFFFFVFFGGILQAGRFSSIIADFSKGEVG